MLSEAVIGEPGRDTDAAHGSPSVCCDTASPDVRGQGLVDVDVGAVALTVDALAPVPFWTISVVPVPGDTEKDPFVGTSVGTEPYGPVAVTGFESAVAAMVTSPNLLVTPPWSCSVPPWVPPLWITAACSTCAVAEAASETSATLVKLLMSRLLETVIRPGTTVAEPEWYPVQGPAKGCTSPPPQPFGL
jgi:hypothetical protein